MSKVWVHVTVKKYLVKTTLRKGHGDVEGKVARRCCH